MFILLFYKRFILIFFILNRVVNQISELNQRVFLNFLQIAKFLLHKICSMT